MVQMRVTENGPHTLNNADNVVSIFNQLTSRLVFLFQHYLQYMRSKACSTSQHEICPRTVLPLIVYVVAISGA